MAVKNMFAKSRKPGNGYVVINNAASGWSWEILKLYKSVASSLNDPYARAFCLVKSPIVPEGEFGDVYISEIPGSRSVLLKLEAEALGGAK
jgi:hypothetical protein